MVLIVAVPIIKDIKINSRCPEVGRKRRPSTTATLGRKRRSPTTVHVRSRATRSSVHNTQRHQFCKHAHVFLLEPNTHAVTPMEEMGSHSHVCPYSFLSAPRNPIATCVSLPWGWGSPVSHLTVGTPPRTQPSGCGPHSLYTAAKHSSPSSQHGPF